MNPYETRAYLEQYRLLHYGDPRRWCPFPEVPRSWFRFHERLVIECILPVRGSAPTRGLDLGCALGRLTLLLAGIVDEVVGVDRSRAFIAAARRELARQPVELRRKVRLVVGDAEQFDEEPFDVVVAVNLLCRLRHPRRFLRRLPALVAPGGQLVLATPYSWLPQFTPRREWIQADELSRLLRADFILRRRRTLPLLLREHARKFQLIFPEVWTWTRRRAAST